MSVLAHIETALLEVATAALTTAQGCLVKQLKSIGGAWTAQELSRALQFAPGVYLGFIGADKGASLGLMNLDFRLYVVTKGAHEAQRRTGNLREVGAYELLNRLVPALSGARLSEFGSVHLSRIENLFAEALFDLGGSVYALNLQLPNQAFESDLTSTLDDFITFDATYALADSQATANDHLTLEPHP